MSPKRSDVRVAIVGAGVMAEAMIAGLLANRALAPDHLEASHPRRDRREVLADRHGISVVPKNAAAVRCTRHGTSRPLASARVFSSAYCPALSTGFLKNDPALRQSSSPSTISMALLRRISRTAWRTAARLAGPGRPAK